MTSDLLLSLLGEGIYAKHRDTRGSVPRPWIAFVMRGLPTALEPGQAAIAYARASADNVRAIRGDE